MGACKEAEQAPLLDNYYACLAKSCLSTRLLTLTAGAYAAGAHKPRQQGEGCMNGSMARMCMRCHIPRPACHAVTAAVSCHIAVRCISSCPHCQGP